jgi:KAP family P-loop domain
MKADFTSGSGMPEPPQTPRFSSSTNKLLRDLDALAPSTDILQMMQTLVKFHGEYGSYAAKYQGKAPSRPFQELIKFLEQNQTFLNFQKYSTKEWIQVVTSITNTPDKDPYINSRMFLLSGLFSEFENITQALPQPDAWHTKCWELVTSLETELLQERKIDFVASLTTHGRVLRENMRNDAQEQQWEDHDALISTENTADAPTQYDTLSRKPLATYLANRLRFVYNRDIQTNGAFFMQIDGAWGSGKSTLLGFLEKELEKGKNPQSTKSDRDWLVVSFNAWENQRLDPPWWFLMNAVYQEISAKVRAKSISRWLVLYCKERLWRWRMSTGYTLAAILALAVFVTSLIYGGNLDSIWIAQIVTFLGFVWSTAKSLSTSLPLANGSSKAAQAFIEANSADPMQKLSEHYRRMIEEVGNPVAVFIDDLDRCNRDYGIKLLEGLQTIFRKAPVVYVIAADRRWLKTMFEEQYETFSEAIATVTKPFGLVFLDKIFQLIVELPDISAAQKRIYWESLLRPRKKSDMAATEANVTQEVQGAPTLSEKLGLIEKTKDPLKKQLYREEIVRTTAIQNEDKTIKHHLMAFVDLIEPNPRAMKRLVNDIGTAKAISILYDQHVEEEQLILWTILKQQHPRLAELLWENPERIQTILTTNGIGPEFVEVLNKQAVRNLFDFSSEEIAVKLDVAFLQKMKFQFEEP